ncbi:hypothetical protein [Fusicatenibacter sp.]
MRKQWIADTWKMDGTNFSCAQKKIQKAGIFPEKQHTLFSEACGTKSRKFFLPIWVKE